MSKNQIEMSILSLGGKSGGIISDASVATAILTGLEAVWVEVLSDTTFTTLTGWNEQTATAYTFLGVNVPTSVAVKAGARFGAGYAKKINSLSHAGGQLAYYDRNDS